MIFSFSLSQNGLGSPVLTWSAWPMYSTDHPGGLLLTQRMARASPFDERGAPSPDDQVPMVTTIFPWA